MTSTSSDQAPLERAVLTVEGMTCSACVGRVERTLTRTEGVKRASVNLVSGTAVVEYISPATTPEALGQAVTRLGYVARPRTTTTDTRPSHVPSPHRNASLASLGVFALAMVLGAPLMHLHGDTPDILAWIAMPFHGALHRLVPSLWSVPPVALGWILLALHLPVLLVWGAPSSSRPGRRHAPGPPT